MTPLMILAAAAAAATASFQDVAALDRAVAAFAGKPLGAEGGPRSPIDARLRLKTCPMVALSWRTEAHDAVVVACTGPDWRVFVPVIRPASAPVAVAGVPLRPVAAAKAEPVIRRGDPVVVEAGASGFAITREGVATGDAAPGGRFGVRVEGASQPVQAIAVSAGRATLPGWE